VAATGTFVVTGAAWTEIKTLSICRTVTITESRTIPGFPRGDFLVMKVPSADGLTILEVTTGTQIQIQAGSSYAFTKASFFNILQPVGFIKMANAAVGSVTFFQDEDEV
jgi:hypothetical protein